jgi:hypothetical protein
VIDPAHFITNFIKLVQGSSSTGAFFVIIGIVAYLLVSFFLSRIFSKAGQPAVAAFIPIWNVVTFFRLGGYSALWVIGSIIGGFYVISVSYLPIGRLTGSHFADSGFAKGMEHAAPLLMPIFGFIFIASSLIGLLAAYNIGRAFEKDGGYLLLFVFLYPVWTLALAFTSYDWDEYSANPNSVGVMNRTRIRKEQATELAANKAKSSKFLDPVAPDNIKREEPESDYDRALREQAARGGVPAQKKSRGKRSKKADPGDAKIVDSGSTGVSEDSEWM